MNNNIQINNKNKEKQIKRKTTKNRSRVNRVSKKENTSSTLDFIKNSGIITDNEYEVQNETEKTNN